MRYVLKTPLYVTIEIEKDSVIASLNDIEAFAYADTEFEAISHLCDEIVNIYKDLHEDRQNRIFCFQYLTLKSPLNKRRMGDCVNAINSRIKFGFLSGNYTKRPSRGEHKLRKPMEEDDWKAVFGLPAAGRVN